MHTILDERDKIKFDEELKSIEDNVIVVSKSGEVLNVTDGSDESLKGLRVFGKTEQETTSGKNKFNSLIVSDRTHNGIQTTRNEDGTIHISGTSTTGVRYIKSDDNEFLRLPAGTYTITPTNFKIEITGGNGRTESGTFTISEETGFKNAYFLFDTTTNQNQTIGIQIEEGTVATPYELYTGGVSSPNPEYPQELVSCENTEVGLYGGNLCIENLKAYITEETRVVWVDNNSETFVFYANKGVTYSFGSDTTGNRTVIGYSDVTPANKVPLYDVEKLSEKTTFTAKHNAYVVIYYNSSRNDEIAKTFRVNVGNMLLPYEPYKDKQFLTISKTLFGIPVTDASLANYTDDNGQMWVCDEVDFERGVFVQRLLYDRVKSSSDWKFSSLTNRFYAEDKRYKKAASDNNTDICFGDYKSTHFINSTHHGSVGEDLSMAYINGTINGFAYRYIALNSDINAWKTFLDENEVYTLGILATPIETPLTEEELAAYKALKMNYPNTTFTNDSNAHMEVKYIADVQNHIEQNYVSKVEYEAAMSQVSMIETAML